MSRRASTPLASLLAPSTLLVAATLLAGQALAQDPGGWEVGLGSPKPKPAPTSQPASQPVSTAAQRAPTSGDRRLQQLERRVKEQQAELEGLNETVGELAGAAAQAQQEKRFSFYGFFDTAFNYIWLPGDVRGEDLLETSPSFLFGNLNTYYDFRPSPSWRLLAEIRLTLAPLGDIRRYEDPFGTKFARATTATNDYSEFGSKFDHGAIEIERAQVEWAPRDWFKLTVGLFLTPFGIWNVDHGSPARLSSATPLFYTSQFGTFNERQLGLMLSGRLFLRHFDLEYALTLSNGRGPMATLLDHDKDKGVGGRVSLRGRGDTVWKLGASAYTTGFSDYKYSLEVAPAFNITKEITVSSRESALGVDLRVDHGPLTFLAEVMAIWHFFDDDKRMSDSPPGAPFLGLYRADYITAGGYGLLAYKLPLSLALQPFVRGGVMTPNDARSDAAIAELAGGVTWRITDQVLLRVEHSAFLWLEDPGEGERSLFRAAGSIQNFMVQLAVSFSS